MMINFGGFGGFGGILCSKNVETSPHISCRRIPSPSALRSHAMVNNYLIYHDLSVLGDGRQSGMAINYESNIDRYIPIASSSYSHDMYIYIYMIFP